METFGIPPEARAEVQKAKGWTQVALLLYAIFGFIFIVVYIPAGDPFFLGLGIIPLFYLVLVYAALYRAIVEGRVRAARTRAMVLGIISFIVGGIISGILLLVAYSKLDRASLLLRQSPPAPPPEYAAPPAPPPQTVEVPGEREEISIEAPTHPQYCPSCGGRLQPPYRFCTNCGARVG